MAKDPLHQFYLGLMPNVVRELYFFIPDSEFTKYFANEVKDFTKLVKLNTVYVLDDYDGPISYTKGRQTLKAIGRSNNLESNLFSLIQKKDELGTDAFKYLLDRYFTYVDTVLYLVKWMDENLKTYIDANDTIKSICRLQVQGLESHLEKLITDFYGHSLSTPQKHYNAHDIIKRYSKDLTKQIKAFDLNSKEVTPQQHTTYSQQTPLKDFSLNFHRNNTSHNKKVLITVEAAEQQLLQTYFNIG